jgi:hypothetical protein
VVVSSPFLVLRLIISFDVYSKDPSDDLMASFVPMLEEYLKREWRNISRALRQPS